MSAVETPAAASPLGRSRSAHGHARTSVSPAAVSPLTLCMVVHAYYPLGEPRVEREARAAWEAGHSVCVVALRGPGELPRETVDGIDVIRLPVRHVRGSGIRRMALEYGLFTALASVEVLKLRRRRSVNVVHVHAPPDFLILVGALPKVLGSKLILDIHDLSPHMFGARFGGTRGGVLSRALRVVERAACGLADHVLTVHEPYRRELEADGVPPEQVTVVMNSMDEALLERVRRTRTQGLPRAADPFTIAYHGTITGWYGVDLLVQALAELGSDVPGARALVLGDGDALPAARRLAEERGVAERCTFSGRYVPIEDALAAVAGAACGVIPNRSSPLNRFALSSKLFEYVALGVPVAVSRLETLKAHFDGDEVTFFEPDDASSLAAALRWIAHHPDEAREKATRAQQRARAYAWRENRVRYLDIVESPRLCPA